MSDNIIILGHDSYLLANAMIKSRYGKYFEYNQKAPGEVDYVLSLGYYKERIQNLLQMYLLYNKVILPQINFDKYLEELIQMGEMEHDDIYYDGIGMPKVETFLQIDCFYAQYLKPLVLEFSSSFSTYFPGTSKLDEYLSIVYDYYYQDHKSDSLIDEFNEIIDYFLPKYIVNNEIYFSKYEILRYDFIKDMKYEIANLMRNISWELECSVRHDCPILQSRSRFKNFQYLGNIENPNFYETYTVISLDIGEKIGYLPNFDTFDEAIKYKNEMKNQIKNFREELKHLEHTLQTAGRTETINKALDDIEKAAKDLKKAGAIKKVGVWTEKLVIPAEVAEQIWGAKLLGVGVQLLAKGIIKTGDYFDKRGNWIQLFR